MIVHTVWGVRKDSPDEPELMTAWDEYSVDNNPEGFREDVQKHLDSWGDDLLEHRQIEILVPESSIRSAFQPQRVHAKVVR